mmetsp:Transcript_56974/g.134501  ORF Transcript_56974/g.134501 Transcript_56974/m.134501 type:complete len:217 (+) Transcript_56974:3845-4495(+)
MSRTVMSGVPPARSTWLVVNACSAVLSPGWLKQRQAKSGGRGESEAALRLRSEHWSMVVGPETDRLGSMRKAGALTVVAALGEWRETRLAERTRPAWSVSASPGTSVAPTPSITLSVSAVVHTHLAGVMADSLAKAASATKTCAQDWSVAVMPARSVAWSNVTASCRPSWFIAMLLMTGGVQKEKRDEAAREVSVRKTTPMSTAASPAAYAQEAQE